jgi:general secretion pathway protein M
MSPVATWAHAGRGGRVARCMLAWGLVALLPLSLVVGVAWPWADRMGALADDIERTHDQLDRYRHLVATLPGLRAELDRVNNNKELKAFYFDGATLSLAGATLQQRVQDIVKEAGGRLVSTQILPENPGEQPPRVQVRIQMQGSTDALLEVLYQLEASRPFLFVDQVSIRSMVQPQRQVINRRLRRGRRGRTMAQREDLTVRLDIYGFALGGT